MTIRRALVLAVTVTAIWLGSPAAQAQRGGRGTAASAQSAAAIDLTGYWVAVVTEDWKFRMVTPKRGVFETLTLNAEGRKTGEAWDPERDAASGEACSSYGAANIMREPGRLRVTWADPNTLRIDTDAGMQTRLFRFGASQPPAGEPTWQGHSVAQWQYAPGAGAAARSRAGSLKVITTHLRPGYVRKNGAPYSADTTVTEYYDRNVGPNGDRWLTVTTKVDDPRYFSRSYITTSDFKQLPDDSGWRPTPCTAT